MLMNSGSAPFRRASKLGAVLALALAMVTGDLPGSPQLSGPPLAFADDDDDGGGSGASAGGERSGRQFRSGRGGARRLFRQIQRDLGFSGGSRERRSRVARNRRGPATASPDQVPRQIVAIGLNEAQVQALASENFRILERYSFGSSQGEAVKLETPDGQTLDAARQRVRNLAPTAATDFNHFYNPSAATACGGKQCVAPGLVGWPSGGRCTGAGVTLGLIDTSINPLHATFANSTVETIKLAKEADAASGSQHGTAVASILVGTGAAGTPGLLPGARLVAVDAFRSSSRQDRAEAFDLIKALDMLSSRGVDAVNMSLAGPANDTLGAMVDKTIAKGIVLVAAAGNEGPRAAPVFPAAYENVIAVTAVDRQKNPYRRANRGAHIDIAAPGVGVWAAASVSGAKPKTGTSFAAPFVTAAAALAKSSGVPATEIARQLTAAAEDLGDPGKDPTYGWGLLNVRAFCRL